MSKEFERIVIQKLEQLESGLKDNNQRLEKLEVGLKDNNQRLGKLEIEVKDTGEVVQYLNNNFTKFDFEINTKIDTLFDAYKVNKEKDDSFEEEINSLEKETFNHDIRISNLEDKVLIA